MFPKYALNALIIISGIGIITTFTFEHKEHKSGLIFLNQGKARISYDTHTVVYHVNISDFLDLSSHINNGINDIQKFTRELAAPRMNWNQHSEFGNGSGPDFIINQMLGELDHIIRDVRDIEAYQQNQRQKRAVEWVGAAYHYAFGLTDAATARKYHAEVIANKEATHRINNMVGEQTTLIKETIAVTNGSIQQLKKHIFALENKLNITSNRQLYLSEILSNSFDIIQLMMLEHRRISKQLKAALENSASGKITQLVPISRLQEDLKAIERLLNDDQRLPVNVEYENPLHVFKFSTATASLFNTQLMVEITIPIIETEHYATYQIIPVPTYINGYNIIIIPSTRFVLVNNKNNEYIPISNDEYAKGIFNLAGEKIIKPAENGYFDYTKNCEMNILINPNKETIEKICDIKIVPTTNYFIPINNNNLFYVSIVKPVVIIEHCHRLPSTTHELDASGILHLDEGCRLNAERIHIRARNNFRTDSGDITLLHNKSISTTIDVFFDKIGALNHTTIPTLHEPVLIREDENDYNRLIKEADNLMEKIKYEKKFNEMDTNDYVHSISSVSISTIILIFCLLIFSLIIYKKFFSESLWMKLANHFNESNIFPKIFVKQVYPTTPFFRRNSSSSTHNSSHA